MADGHKDSEHHQLTGRASPDFEENEMGKYLQLSEAIDAGLAEAAVEAAELTRGRGGAGRGQGRKPLSAGDETVGISLRVTASQRAKLARLGGGAWVRRKIDAEQE